MQGIRFALGGNARKSETEGIDGKRKNDLFSCSFIYLLLIIQQIVRKFNPFISQTKKSHLCNLTVDVIKSRFFVPNGRKQVLKYYSE